MSISPQKFNSPQKQHHINHAHKQRKTMFLRTHTDTNTKSAERISAASRAVKCTKEIKKKYAHNNKVHTEQGGCGLKQTWGVG